MADIQSISAHTAADMLQQHPDYKLIDVREDFEREIACIAGSIQLTETLTDEMEQTWPKDTPLIFHCHHGGRSNAAANYFLGCGFQHVFNVVGGIDAWAIEVDPTLARY